MENFWKTIQFTQPDAMFLVSSSNRKKSDDDIYTMGKRLADEVKQYINDSIPLTYLSRISFIGFSLGGLVIRAALPYLIEYKLKMHAFITLGTPHLGLMYHSTKLISTGISFWNIFATTKAL